MRVRRGVLAFVWLAAVHAGCAKGQANGDGDDTGDDSTDGDDVGVPDAGGGGLPDAQEQEPDAGGGGGPITLTHSNTMAVEAETGVACQNGFGNARNQYYRVFDLPALGVTGALEVTQMTVGIQEASSGDGNGQPASVKLHKLDGEFLLANLDPIASRSFTVDDQELQLVVVPISAMVPAGSTLVAEFAFPNGQVAGDFLFPGANNDGQTGPTWVRSECGASQPTDAADIGFPDMHLVLSVDAIEQ